MDQQESEQSDTTVQATAAPETEGWVDARVPLFLLETLQSTDLPSEVLEDEDVAVSMPRRFGLNNMVHTHIHRFRTAAAKKGRLPASDLRHWIQLVIRRPDAEELLAQTGARFANVHWHGRPGLLRLLVRFAPAVMGRMLFAREAASLIRPVTGSKRYETRHSPITVGIDRPVMVAADPGGAACALYTGALTELAALAGVSDPQVRHTSCSATGGDQCEWTVRTGKSD